MSVKDLVSRQFDIANGADPSFELPKQKIYSICNLRGGIGKTTLAFNLSYLGDDVLAVDTCPQGNLSYYFDDNYYSSSLPNVRDLIEPYIYPNYAKASHVSRFVGATNSRFENKHTYFIPSNQELFLLPAQISSAIQQTSFVRGQRQQDMVSSIIFSLRTEIEREMDELNGAVSKCLIDTSPFFPGATQLSWYASDGLIIPIRTDQQSVKSFELLLKMLTSKDSDYRRYIPDNFNTPKIHIVVLTHCGWSTSSGARNVPNNPTMVYINKVYELMRQYKHLLTTDEVDNHLFLLDDFLGAGRISSFRATPLELLRPKESCSIARQKVTVNESVVKCQNQLKYISKLLW